MLDGVNLSIGSLFGKLHEAIVSFVANLNDLVEENREVPLSEIRELREHIKQRLNSNESIDDNQKLMKLLDLFSTDKAVIELVRDEAQDWLDMLEAIENSFPKDRSQLTQGQRDEIRKVEVLTSQVKALIRK